MQEARNAGVIFCRVKSAQIPRQAGFCCQMCGLTFLTKAAMAAHSSKVHQALAPASRLASGTSCAVCMKEFWTRDRVRLHLRKSLTCQQVLNEADLEDASEPPRHDRHCQWLPATRLVGPQPWWASLRPSATDDQQPTTVEAWRPFYNRLRQCISSDLPRLPQAVREVVEQQAFSTLCEDDLPLDVAELSCQYRELLRLLVQVCSSVPSQSEAPILNGAWSTSFSGERVIIWPSSLARWQLLRSRLPTEWAFSE